MVVAAAATVVAGCGSSATTATSPTSLSRCGVGVTGTTSVPAQGGTGSVSVTAARECQWSASADGTWLTIKSGATGQGDGTVEFTAAANPDPATRRGGILLNDQRLDVTQAAGECVIALGGVSASFSPSGGAGHVDVRASSALCTWTVQADADWIVLRSGPNGKGTAQVDYEVAPTTGPPRNGTITVAGQRFSVLQSEGCTYAVEPRALTVGSAGGTFSVRVSSATACPWSVSNGVPWITVNGPQSLSGTGAVTLSVAPTTGPPRSATVTIAGQPVTVAQQAQACTYGIAPEGASVPAAGGTGTIAITAGAGCSWSATPSDTWIQIVSGASGSGSGAVAFSVGPSTGPARSGTVAVAGAIFTISQAAAAAPCSYALSSSTQTFPAAGGSGKVAVTAASGCGWTASSGEPWIQLVSGATGNGGGDVTFTVAPTTMARSGTMTIAGQTFTVRQSAPEPCTYALSAPGQTIPSAGGAGSVDVLAGAGCSWTASSGAAWLSITSGASGSGNGTVAFSAAPEESGAPRTGTLLIAGQTFTVSQTAGCTFAISPEQFQAAAPGGATTVSVTTTPACAWTSASGADWITVLPLGTPTGSGTVAVTVAPNPGAARTGTATIAGRTFTVVQEALPIACTYQVQPVEVKIGPKDKVVKISVTTAPLCTWTAASGVPWITIARGEAGTGSGEVWLAVADNDGPERKGSVTIAGQSVLITQRQ